MTETAQTILVIDDDDNVREVLLRYLTRAGYRVEQAADGATGLQIALHRPVQLIILDLMMPGLDGLDVCTAIRRAGTTPVIMVTALGSESDRVVGLETGADDYVVKPFSPREVVLRVQRVLERTQQELAAGDEPVLVDGDLEVNLPARTATRAGQPVALTSREFDLLVFLILHPDQAFTRAELMRQVWQWEFGDDSTVTVHARRLREKIEIDPAAPRRLVTVWGHGYRYHRSGKG